MKYWGMADNVTLTLPAYERVLAFHPLSLYLSLSIRNEKEGRPAISVELEGSYQIFVLCVHLTDSQ